MKRLLLLALAGVVLASCATAQPLPNRFPYIYLRDSLSLSALANYRLRVALRDTGWGISDLNESLFNLIYAGTGGGEGAGQNNVLKSKDGAGASMVGTKTDTTLWVKRLKGSAFITITDLGDSVEFALVNPVVSAAYLTGYTGATADTVYVYTKGGWRTIIGGSGGTMTGDQIATALNGAARHFTLTGPQWHDSLKATLTSVSNSGGLRLKTSAGTGTTSPYVLTTYPATSGLATGTGGYGLTGTKIVEKIYGASVNNGWSILRDSLGLFARTRNGYDVGMAGYGAWEGGPGLDLRMIPDRLYGGMVIGNKIDANGNLSFYHGNSGSATTVPWGLLNVVRSGVRTAGGVLNYSNDDNWFAIKAEHMVENTAATGLSAGAVQGFTYLLGTAGTETAKELSGFSGGVWVTAYGGVNRAIGQNLYNYFDHESVVIDSSFGVLFQSVLGENGGTVSNDFGIYVRPLVGTKKYSFYGAGLTDSLINEGPVRVPKLILNSGDVIEDLTKDSSTTGNLVANEDDNIVDVTIGTGLSYTSATRTLAATGGGIVQTKEFTVLDTVKTGGEVVWSWKVPYAITITQVSAYTDANTVTFNLWERAAATPNTAGDSVMTAPLVADNNEQVTTTFVNAAQAANTWLTATVQSAGDVARFCVTIFYTKD